MREGEHEARTMLLYFLLDLRNISFSLLRDIQQCLLQLANLYAASTGGGERTWRKEETSLLSDQIGICYIPNKESSSSSSSELEVAYKPGGHFSLPDFHHAVNNLPMKFSTESSEHMLTQSDNQVELSIRKILSDEFLHLWNPEDTPKKVIVATTCVFTSSESLQMIVKNAATQLVTIEFVVLEEDMSQKQSGFIHSLDHIHNCIIHRHTAETGILPGLVRRWLQDIRYNKEAPEALLIFKHAFWGYSNQISCKMFASTDMIEDGFTSCQVCRCHGCPISYASNSTKKNVCPVTFLELENSDLIDYAVRLGGGTVLTLPSVDGSYKLQRITSPITLNVIERTKLASLDEGVIMGTSYVVIPACHEMEAADEEVEMNAQIFHGLDESLHCLDQGLVCSSNYNLETMAGGNFTSFYILQPSGNGPMLLRRIAGSEEILPVPIHLKPSVVSEKVKNSIQSSLTKVLLRDYNPLEHERGLHPHLNCLVKESLHLESLSTAAHMSPKLADAPAVILISDRENDRCPKPNKLDDAPAVILISDEENDCCPKPKQEDDAFSCVADEWEQLLIVDDINNGFSGGSISVQNTRNSVQTHDSKPLDERTSRILERLEAPKSSPSISAKTVSVQKPKPSSTLDPTSTQPLRPNIHRPKRKLR